MKQDDQNRGCRPVNTGDTLGFPGNHAGASLKRAMVLFKENSASLISAVSPVITPGPH